MLCPTLVPRSSQFLLLDFFKTPYFVRFIELFITVKPGCFFLWSLALSGWRRISAILLGNALLENVVLAWNIVVEFIHVHFTTFLRIELVQDPCVRFWRGVSQGYRFCYQIALLIAGSLAQLPLLTLSASVSLLFSASSEMPPIERISKILPSLQLPLRQIWLHWFWAVWTPYIV